MGAFSHILTLVAFVFAVSLAQLLLRISTLVAIRGRVAFSGLTALAICNAILLVYANWLAMWELHTANDWQLLPITVVFLFSLSVCFVCTLSAPHEFSGTLIDLDAFYWYQRKTYWWSWIVCECLAIVGNQVFPSPAAARLSAESLMSLAMFPPILLALLVPKRWAQWAGGGALFALNTIFLVVFERQLT